MAATTTQKLGGKGLMIVTAQVMHLPANDTYPATMIPIALIAQSSKDVIMVMKHYTAMDDDHHSTITKIRLNHIICCIIIASFVFILFDIVGIGRQC